MHVIESEFIAEVIDTATDEPVPEGESCELVLTNLGRVGSPLIRYRTGDQVRLPRAHCACGRWFARAEGGVLGGIDDMLLIRGNNVFPAAIEGVLREFDEVAEFRLTVDRSGPMAELHMMIETVPGVNRHENGIVERVTVAARDRLHFAPSHVELTAPGTPPRWSGAGCSRRRTTVRIGVISFLG